MNAQRKCATRNWDFSAAQYHHIRIVPHTEPKRKTRKHIIAVKAITYAAALVAIYGLLYLENSLPIGITIFGISFTYLLLFAWANGGFR